MGLVTQRNQKLEKLFNDLAIDPKEKAKPKDKLADKEQAEQQDKQ
ncbi:SPJ_0845 family protein [Limosilactobacillus mucosae]